MNPKTRKDLITFYLIVFGLSWAIFFTIFFIEKSTGNKMPRGFQAIAALAVFGGTILSSWKSDGKVGVKELLKRCFLFKVSWKWYTIIFIPMILIGISVAIAQFFETFEVGTNPIGNLLIGLVLITIFMVFGEEIAWRGYALPKFQRHYSALKSSLITGFLWGIWHLPIWLIEPERAWGLPFVLAFVIFTIGNIAFTVFYAFITNSTKGSILICALYHAAGNVLIGWLNYPDEFDKYTIPIFTILLVLLAFAIIKITGPSNLSKKNRFTI